MRRFFCTYKNVNVTANPFFFRGRHPITQINEEQFFEIEEQDRKERSFPSQLQEIVWNTVDASYNFQCPICLRLLERPHVVLGCLHRFCEVCINRAVQTGSKACPVTLAKLQTLFLFLFAQLRI